MTLVEVGEAIVATLRAGGIRASMADGSEVRPPSVVVAPPAVGFVLPQEGWLVGGSDWDLHLYSARGGAPNVAAELELFEELCVVMSADVHLSGTVSFSYPLGSEAPVAINPRGSGPPTMFRRSLRLHVDH